MGLHAVPGAAVLRTEPGNDRAELFKFRKWFHALYPVSDALCERTGLLPCLFLVLQRIRDTEHTADLISGEYRLQLPEKLPRIPAL